MNKLLQYIFISFLLHLVVFSLQKPEKIKQITERKVLKIRTIGEDTGKSGLVLKEHNKIQKGQSPSQLKPSAIQASDLKLSKKQKKINPSDLNPNSLIKVANKPAIDALRVNKDNIKAFLKNSPTGINSRQALNALGLSDVKVKLEIPKGVKEDELNKRELVFYGFQRRTALAYINSFYSELNKFEKHNPHLHFPITQKREKLTGRVSYDKEGNILRIETIQWSNKKKLQSFFMDVLKNMNTLPNPPKEILNGEQFAIYFSLTVNN